MRLSKHRNPLLAGIIATLASLPVTAQTAGTAGQPTADAGVTDIVVTAQRRSERLQDVPISVAAITSDTLTKQGVTSTTDLSQSIAGLNVTTQSGSVFPHIRGVGNSNIGPGFENGVAVYVDGVYYSSTQASILSLSNIERVEVLKGPQGTLFGRNTTGGLIQVVTREPSQELGGTVRLSYGNYQTITADAYVTGGLAPNLALDFAAHSLTQGKGYGKNLANGEDVYKQDEDVALRSSLLFTPGDSTRIRISGDYSHTVGSMFARSPTPGTIPILPHQAIGDPWNISADLQPHDRFEGGGVSGQIRQDVGFARLTSITAYRKSRNYSAQDGDNTSTPGVDLLLTQRDQQFSQEIQLASNPGSRINWIVGAYYFDGHGHFDPARVLFFGGVRPVVPFGTIIAQDTIASLKTSAIAGFAQATAPLGSATNLTLGIRYTSEHRSIDATQTADLASGVVNVPLLSVDQARRYSKPTWRASLDHHFTPELMAYASYNRGFKSGGFNGSAPTAPSFEPEVLDAYETGLKSELFDRKLRLNVAAYYYNYKNIQVSRYPPGATIVYNGAAARVYGVDADFEARPTRELTLRGGAAWSHNKFTSFPGASYFVPVATGGNLSVTADGSGNHLPEAPSFTANADAEYRVPTAFGAVSLSANYSYNSGYYAQPDNIFFVAHFGLVNAALNFELGHGLDFQFWGRNLTNAAVPANLASSNLVTASGYRPPRTYGITLSAKF